MSHTTPLVAPLSATANSTLHILARVIESANSNNHIRSNKQTALEIIAATVEDQKIDDESRGEQADGFEQVEVQAHVRVKDPAEEDDDGGDEEGDLDARADGDADGQVHFVLACDGHGCDVLGCVADDGEDDETDEGLADGRVVDHFRDGVDEEFSADSDQSSGEQEHDDGSSTRHAKFAIAGFRVFAFV